MGEVWLAELNDCEYTVCTSKDHRMDTEQIAYNQQLLQTYRAVLHELERQAATMGILTPRNVSCTRHSPFAQRAPDS